MTGFPQNFRITHAGITYQPLWATETDDHHILWSFRCPSCGQRARFQSLIEVNMDTFAPHRRCDACDGGR